MCKYVNIFCCVSRSILTGYMLWDFCPFILLLQRWESGSGGWAYRRMSREEYISLQNPEMIAVSIAVEN